MTDLFLGIYNGGINREIILLFCTSPPLSPSLSPPLTFATLPQFLPPYRSLFASSVPSSESNNRSCTKCNAWQSPDITNRQGTGKTLLLKWRLSMLDFCPMQSTQFKEILVERNNIIDCAIARGDSHLKRTEVPIKNSEKNP